MNDPWLLHYNLESSLVPQQLTISLKFCQMFLRKSQLFLSKTFLLDLEMSVKTMLSNTHQLHRKHQICLHKFEVFSEIYFPGQDLVFKVAFLSSLSMFPWNPVNLTVIFLAADSYLFYAPSTSLGQASQGTRLFSLVTESKLTFQVCGLSCPGTRRVWQLSRLSFNSSKLLRPVCYNL